MYFLNALLCEHMGLCFPRLFQSWEVEVFYHVFTSRLFLSPTHPQRPYDSHRTFPSSPGGLDAGSSAACQCQHVGQTASLPAQRGRVCSRCSTHCARARISYQLFFFFFFERARFQEGSPSFPFCHLLWVESCLIGVGNSNKKKCPVSVWATFHADTDRYLTIATITYFYPHTQLLPLWETKKKKIYILYLQSYQQLSDTSICNTSRSFLAFFYA